MFEIVLFLNSPYTRTRLTLAGEASPYPIETDHARQGVPLQALGQGFGGAVWLSPQTRSFVRSDPMSLFGRDFSSTPCSLWYWHVRKNIDLENRLYVAKQPIESRRND
jgi:hypothetical protein